MDTIEAAGGWGWGWGSREAEWDWEGQPVGRRVEPRGHRSLKVPCILACGQDQTPEGQPLEGELRREAFLKTSFRPL